MSRRMGVALPLADLTEQEWAAQVAQLARTLGWRRYHTYRSQRSAAGWPDEALVRERLILAELKRENTKPSPAQADWLTALATAGAEVYLWRPSDLDEIGRILGERWWEFGGYRRYSDTALQFGHLKPLSGPVWVPGSLWLPEGCRRDELVDEAA